MSTAALERPRTIEVDPPSCGAAEQPVAVGRRAFVAGVRGASPGGATVCAIDVVEGRAAWTVTFPSDDYARDLATSTPLPRPDGGAWLAVHQFDGGVVVHGVDAEGRIDARIDLPDAYPLTGASDSGSKVMLRLAAAGAREDGFLCAWTYRQVRTYGVTRFGARGDPIWSAPEWLLACDGVTAITCPAPERRAVGASADRSSSTYPPLAMTLLGRDVHTGAELWRSHVQDTSVGTLTNGRLLLVDRSSAFDDARQRERELEERFVEGALSEAELDAAIEHLVLGAPTRVRAVEATTGVELWRLDGGAQVLGLAAGAGGVAVLARDPAGTIRLRAATVDGSPGADLIVVLRSTLEARLGIFPACVRIARCS